MKKKEESKPYLMINVFFLKKLNEFPLIETAKKKKKLFAYQTTRLLATVSLPPCQEKCPSDGHAGRYGRYSRFLRGEFHRDRGITVKLFSCNII